MDTKSTNNREFLLRAIIWAGCGATLGLRGNDIAKLALAGPVGEQLTGLKLEDIIMSLLKSNYNRNHLRHNPQNSSPVISEIKNQFCNGAQGEEVTVPSSAQYVKTARDSKWLEVIPHPSVVLTLGRRGSGKTATAHRILELVRFRSLPFIAGMPQRDLKDLPEWLGVINNPEEAPENTTLLIDETHLRFNARDSQTQMSREIGRIINLSRQKTTNANLHQSAGTDDRQEYCKCG